LPQQQQNGKPSPRPYAPSGTPFPSRWKFPANDPRFAKPLKLLRLHPWLGRMLNAYDLYQHFNELEQPHGIITGPFDPGINGFTLVGTCANPGGSANVLVWGYPNPGGLANGCNIARIAGVPLGTEIPSSVTSLNSCYKYSAYGKFVKGWTRPAGEYPVRSCYSRIDWVPDPFLQPAPLLKPWPVPALLPEIAPFRAPAQAPRPSPAPYKDLPAIKTPFKESGYDYPTPQKIYPVRNSNPRNPDLVFKPSAKGNLRASLRPSNHGYHRPPGGVREIKLRSSAHAAAAIVMGAATETGDFISALWGALPYADREQGYSGHMQDKLADLYNHAGHVDVQKALGNLVANELEDRLYGSIGNRIKKLNPEFSPTHGGRGLMLGSSQRRKISNF